MADNKSNGSRPFLIGITGGSGSGKTTFVDRLRDRFSEKELCVLSQDNYYKDRQDQYVDDNGIKNFDRLDSIDIDRFVEDVNKLCNGTSIHIEEYTFNNDLKQAQMLTFHSAPVILLEGLFVFANTKLRSLLDLKLYVYAHEIRKVIRRIKRDGIERNYPLDDVLYRYENHVMPSFEKNIKPYYEHADLIINNNYSMDTSLEVIAASIEKKIGES